MSGEARFPEVTVRCGRSRFLSVRDRSTVLRDTPESEAHNTQAGHGGAERRLRNMPPRDLSVGQPTTRALGYRVDLIGMRRGGIDLAFEGQISVITSQTTWMIACFFQGAHRECAIS